MSKKEEEFHNAFFEYLMALNSTDYDMEDRLKKLEEEVKELSNYVHVVQRGPKGDKGQDGTDGESIKLTEEDIKNAVRKGVAEGLEEFTREMKQKGGRNFFDAF